MNTRVGIGCPRNSVIQGEQDLGNQTLINPVADYRNHLPCESERHCTQDTVVLNTGTNPRIGAWSLSRKAVWSEYSSWTASRYIVTGIQPECGKTQPQYKAESASVAWPQWILLVSGTHRYARILMLN